MSKMKKLLAMLLALAMVLGMSMTTFAADGDGKPDADDKEPLQVSGLEEGLTVNAYQIVKALYNENGFVEYASVKVGDTALVEVEGDQWNDIAYSTVFDIAGNISNGTYELTSIPMEHAGNGTYTAELNAGVWIVLAQGGLNVYNPMIVSAYYSTSGTVEAFTAKNVTADMYWTIDGQNAVAKVSDTYVTKNANETTWDLGDDVTYTVTSEVPQYATSYVANKVKYQIVDTVTANELAIKTNTINVKVGADTVIENGVVKEAYNGKVTLEASETGYTVALVKQYILDSANKIVEITYDAAITGDVYADQAENKSHDNIVTLTYSNAPNSDSVAEKTAEESVYTFRVNNQIKKTGENGNVLPGAVFTIYTDSACTDTSKYENAKHPDGTVKSGSDGFININGLDLGTYYIKETVAPEGYSLNKAVFRINIAATEAKVENEADTVSNIKVTLTQVDGTAEMNGDVLIIPNTRLASLPSTGGIGTTMFTIGGCAIMIAAAYLFFTSRKREEA